MTPLPQAGPPVTAGPLQDLPPLVFAEECDRLRDRLAAVARGEAFLLQGGESARSFDGTTAESVGGILRTLLQMAVVLTYAASVPVVKVGRIDFGRVDFGGPAGSADPGSHRLRRMYEASATTLNLVRAFGIGGHADLHQVHEWNRGFVTDSPARRRYTELADGIERSLRFMHACGVDPKEVHTVDFFAGHEGRRLDYEEALTRTDARTGLPYATSAHLLWAALPGRETADDEHLAYLSRIHNPVAVELGPDADPDTVLACVDRLDPDRVPGRLTFITRMGAELVRDRLPALVRKAEGEGATPVWVCDPVRGNTVRTAGGHVVHDFDALLDEVRGFFEVHRACGTHAGGIHVALTGDRAAGAARGARLDRAHSLDLAFLVAEMMGERV